MDILSRRMRDLRVDSDMKQSDMGNALGISQNMVSNYENGREPPIEVILAYSSYFNVSVEYLLGVSSERQIPRSLLESELTALAVDAEKAGDTPLSLLDFGNVVSALRTYYANGAPAGGVPISCTKTFLRAMCDVLDAASRKDAASLLLACNDVATAGLNVTSAMSSMLGVRPGGVAESDTNK